MFLNILESLVDDVINFCDRFVRGTVLQLHQEAQCQPPASKKRTREEEQIEERMTRKRKTEGGADENWDPADVLRRNPGTLSRDQGRWVFCLSFSLSISPPLSFSLSLSLSLVSRNHLDL